LFIIEDEMSSWIMLNILTRRLKAGIVEQEEEAIFSQRRYKHISPTLWTIYRHLLEDVPTDCAVARTAAPSFTDQHPQHVFSRGTGPLNRRTYRHVIPVKLKTIEL
jgi:hypothetical protein